MKKILCILIVCALSLSLTSCGSKKTNSKQTTLVNSQTQTSSGTYDIDLTTLSSTMVYSEVSNMMMTPENYIGKTVKMKGLFSVYQDEQTGNTYYSCVISDATACCAQGIEFILKDDTKYPAANTEITVSGTFETYIEEETLYCHLTNAQIETV